MEKNITLEDAVKRIKKLEKENAELKEELEYYKNRKMSGRQKHNAKWMAIYNDFVVGYEKRDDKGRLFEGRIAESILEGAEVAYREGAVGESAKLIPLYDSTEYLGKSERGNGKVVAF